MPLWGAEKAGSGSVGQRLGAAGLLYLSSASGGQLQFQWGQRPLNWLVVVVVCVCGGGMVPGLLAWRQGSYSSAALYTIMASWGNKEERVL